MDEPAAQGDPHAACAAWPRLKAIVCGGGGSGGGDAAAAVGSQGLAGDIASVFGE